MRGKQGVSISIAALVGLLILNSCVTSLAGKATIVSSNAKTTTARTDSSEDAFVILSTETVESMAESLRFIQKAGGSISHVFSTRAVIGKIPRSLRNELVGRKGILEVTHSPVDLSDMEKHGKIVVMAAEAWNNNFMGQAGQKGLRPHPGFVDPDPIRNDTRPPLRPQNRTSMTDSPLWAPYGAGFYDMSEYMIGNAFYVNPTIAVGIVMPESTGAIDVNREDWTTTERNNVVSEITAAMDWWKNREPRAHLSFQYEIQYLQTGYEPISRSSDDEGLWIAEVLSALGFSTGSYISRAYSYANDLRTRYKTDWAVVIFVVDSSSDSDGCFTDGSFAYAYLGGPFMVMTYGNNGYGIANMDAVTAHEMGHLFYAPDEYWGAWSAADPSRTWGYLAVQNQNSVMGGSSNVPCIMRGQVSPYTSGSVCQYTRGHVGWRDNDGDNVLDIVDFLPQNTLNVYTPDPTGDTTPTYTGQALSRQCYPNSNPYTDTWHGYYSTRTDITVNKIWLVEYWVEDLSGNKIRDKVVAAAIDGVFDSSSEGYTFTVSPDLPGATYKFLTVAWTTEGQGTIVSDQLTISTPQITITSSPTGSGFVTVDGSPIVTPQVFTWIQGSTHTLSASSPVSGGTGIQYVWVSWSDGGVQSHTITTPWSATTYTANFKRQYMLTTSVSPTAAGGLSVSSGWRDEGVSVSVTATANSGYSFYYWSLDGVNMGSNPSISVAMNSPRSLTAMFRSTSSLSLGLSSGSISLGSSVTLSGTVTPTQPLPGIPTGTTIVLSYSLAGGSWNVFIMTQTGSGGAYSVAWYPPYPGIYQIRASWDGNPNYEGATSGVLSLNVTGVVPPRVTLVLSGPSSAARGDSVTFEILVDNGGSALSATLYLEIVGPGGYRYFDFQRIVVGEGQRGRYQFTWQVPSTVGAGQYQVNVGLIPPKPTAIARTQVAVV
jgi:hypothetical protein